MAKTKIDFWLDAKDSAERSVQRMRDCVKFAVKTFVFFCLLTIGGSFGVSGAESPVHSGSRAMIIVGIFGIFATIIASACCAGSASSNKKFSYWDLEAEASKANKEYQKALDESS